MTTNTWVLDRIFDTARGWEIPANAAPVQRGSGVDGSTNYLVTVDGINIVTWEIHRWREGITREVPAGRLAARVDFTGVNIHRPQGLLTDTFAMDGLPSFGINPTGQPTLHTAFPIAPGFPVDIARRQLMVCIGTLAVQAQELLAIWNSKPVPPRPAPVPQSTVDWGRAKGIAAVAGAFLGAFIGL